MTDIIEWLKNIPPSFTKFFISSVIVFILIQVPIIGRYFSVLNTLIHEVGHALMAILTGGRANKIELYMNSEGVAHHQSRFWIGRVLTSLAGYLASSLTALLFVKLIYKERFDIILIILTALFLVSLAFWVRNLYGLIWQISFSAIFIGLLWLNIEPLTQFIVYTLTAIIFVESLTTSFDIMKLGFKKPNDAGDATSLARSTLVIPAQAWGVVFFVSCLTIGYYSVMVFFP